MTAVDTSPDRALEFRLSHLRQLEAESIHIIREVAAEFDNPVMLYSIGKDSSVMVQLARKAFHPGKLPFPLLHIDTTWKFKEMIQFRDKFVKDNGLNLIVHTNQEGLEENINPFDHGSSKYTTIMKTQALLQALSKGGYDAAFGGARRDEERSRAKERIYSFRDRYGQWDPKNQRPELWNLYNGKLTKGESIRAFPLSNWTELDIWLYIYLESIPIVPLYFAAERPVVERNGTLLDGRRRALAAQSRRKAAHGEGALPHPRLLPADRRAALQRHHAARHHPRNAAHQVLRALRPAHRSRRRRLDGNQEARRLLLTRC